MVNIYKDFNSYIKNTYFPEQSRGETITLSVDKKVINDFCTETNKLKKDVLPLLSIHLRRDWEAYCKGDQGFGLCAIQVFIAHQMQNDEHHTTKQYNPRLYEFLDLNINELQDRYNKWQERLWGNLQYQMTSKGFHLNIPSPRAGAGRYTQYPLSQVLLNEEDLKKIPTLFEKIGIRPFEHWAFNDFKKLIAGADTDGTVSSHYLRVKERLKSNTGDAEQLFYQLFDYYNNIWDGKYPERQNNTSWARATTNEKKNVQLVLTETLEEIYVFDEAYNLIDSIKINQCHVFNDIKKQKTPRHTGLVIFEEDKSYGEWNEVNYMQFGRSYVLIASLFSSMSDCISDLGCSTENIPSPYCSIYKTSTINSLNNSVFWQSYFSTKSKSFQLSGGLKIGRWTWMEGVGPQLSFSEACTVWLNGEKISAKKGEKHDYHNLPVGEYKIKEANCSPEKFEIAMPSTNISYSGEDAGWQVTLDTGLWKNEHTNLQIIGMHTSFGDKESLDSIRKWIQVQIINHEKSSTLAINAINRSKYGVRY